MHLPEARSGQIDELELLLGHVFLHGPPHGPGSVEPDQDDRRPESDQA
jgi:hypothetical protein